jgi:hypothetical protein
MEKIRKAYIVYVDLDPVPGAMHSKESAQHYIRMVLINSLGNYNPTVSLAPASLQSENDN